MGPIPFPSEKQPGCLLVCACVGAVSIVGGAVAVVVWVCSHLRWAS